MLSCEIELNDKMKKFWEFDKGIAENASESGYYQENVKCIKMLHQKTKWLQGKYEVPMLWSDKVEELPNNFSTALQRFRSLKKRLQMDPNLYENYKDTMHKYIKNEYARKLSSDEIEKTSQRTWYLPQHPIFNEHNPNKVRIFFHAAAKHDGVSFNKALLTGPDFLNNLTGILLRFRNHKVEIAADIEAMYRQVRVSKSDEEALRLLWQGDLSQSGPEVYQIMVHIFDGKDSSCCANYALKKTGRDNFNHYNPPTIESVLKSFYMLDFLKSVPSKEQAKQLRQEMIEVMAADVFSLTKCKSNSADVLSLLPDDKHERSTSHLETD